MKRVKVKPTPGVRSPNATRSTSTSPGLFIAVGGVAVSTVRAIEDEAHLVKQRPRPPYLAKDTPVPPRQPFKLLPHGGEAGAVLVDQLAGGAVENAVYEPRAIRSSMPLPPPVTLYTLGPWAACSVCGEPTRALPIITDGFFLSPPPKPRHIVCRQRRAARSEPNRHERRRAGLPRPPMPDDVRAWAPGGCRGAP
jgi:hypothetical protein